MIIDFILDAVASATGCFLVVGVLWWRDSWNRGRYDRERRRAEKTQQQEQSKQKRRR